MKSIYISCLLIVGFLSVTYGLECYVCEQQEGNDDKCVKTVRMCQRYEDTCATLILYTTPHEWTPRLERRHYISKGCDTRDACTRLLYGLASVCTRNWYEDWACVECCQGDRCNRYVVLGSNNIRASVLLLAMMSLASLFIRF
ncbi:unnamed protein product [Rotaria magnacalcarata]|uniref:Uncharacterized protein n=1 Tax=Rotaria magnacalcarata TaxID=392030 RepID=A0A816V0N0_9BILA|nr:unnamed protein product [Rotaria magnacalcarata]CAF2118446.1 unnamed protein product [Rotaria magnacalcarata]CAF4332093.1 unnamed protein product [Rotaria magnacalcarata]CAF4420610.1 unnamed protein product [Rotaria magnacalcarata]